MDRPRDGARSFAALFDRRTVSEVAAYRLARAGIDVILLVR
jgi:hypothetical protein